MKSINHLKLAIFHRTLESFYVQNNSGIFYDAYMGFLLFLKSKISVKKSCILNYATSIIFGDGSIEPIVFIVLTLIRNIGRTSYIG